MRERKFQIKEIGRRIKEFYDELYLAPYRAEHLRQMRAEDDLFIMILFCEELGLPNPIHWYTIELYPLFMERLHEWHLRMGMEHSPFDGMKCC